MDASHRSSDRDQIRALVEKRVPALAAKDSAALAGDYAADAVLFDAVGPLGHHGAEAQAARLAEWLSLYDGPIDYRIRDLEITAGADVGFCHWVYRVGGTTRDGKRVGMWLRSTIGVRKVGDRWLITHEHTSVPFEGTTGAASLDLSP